MKAKLSQNQWILKIYSNLLLKLSPHNKYININKIFFVKQLDIKIIQTNYFPIKEPQLNNHLKKKKNQ